MKASVDRLILRYLGVIEPGAIHVPEKVVLGPCFGVKGGDVDAWGGFHPFILEDS